MTKESPDRESTNGSSKAERTREKILLASWTVFGRDGFGSARVADIVKEASVAHGTFYTYFDSKNDVFAELASQALARIDETISDMWSIHLPPNKALIKVMESYLSAYRAEAPILMLLEQAAANDAGITRMRDDLNARVVERAVQVIERFQAAGLADKRVDAKCAAVALGSMVESFAYRMSLNPDEFEQPAVIETLARIWRGGIGLRPDQPEHDIDVNVKDL